VSLNLAHPVFSNHFVTNLIQNVPVKKMKIGQYFCQRYG